MTFAVGGRTLSANVIKSMRSEPEKERDRIISEHLTTLADQRQPEMPARTSLSERCDMVPRADLAVRSIEGEVVVFDRAGGYVHHLNATASLIWSTLDGDTGREEIVARLAARFEIDPVVAASDVQTVLDKLTALHLLERSSNGKGGECEIE